MMNSGMRHIINEFMEHDSEHEWDQLGEWNFISEKHRKTLMNAFPKPADLAAALTDGHAKEWDFDFKMGNWLIFICDWQGPITEMKRVFDFDDGFLELRSFEIDSEYRGEMHGRRILISTISACLKLNIHEMRIEASNLGSYVWARAGFVPNDKSWSKVCETVRDRIIDKESIFGVVPKKNKDRILELINDNDPKTIWKIVDDRTMIHGKYLMSQKLLEFVYWRGAMDLNDSECVDRVREYCKPK